MVTTWLRFTMSSFSAYDTIVSLFDFGCKSTTHFLIVQVFGYKSFFFPASAKNSGFRQSSRGLFVGLFESCFCSHELTHLSLIVSILRSWFLSVTN